MRCRHLLSLLETAADSSPSRGLIISRSGNTKSCTKITYQNLLTQAQYRGGLLQCLEGFRNRLSVLIHLDDYSETFLWFWAVLYADAVPVITAPFSNIAEQRRKHIGSLADLLQHPICITSSKLVKLFDGQNGLNIQTTESILSNSNHAPELYCSSHVSPRNNNLPFLMLMSGSTGTPKAVCLSHRQVYSAIEGKIAF